MSEIIELMTSKGNGGQKFTVDTTLPPNGQSIVTQGSFETDNTELKSIFAQGDNLAIISAGIILPESFLLGNIGFGAAPLSALPKLEIYFFTEPGHIKYYPVIAGSQGNFLIPMENYEYILNNFIDVTKGPFITGGGVTVDKIPGNFALYLSVDPASVKISMVNVPAVLNNQVMRITPFVKIVHNIPLIV
jgi:hypothetical protein